MKMKRTLSIIIVFALICALLVACNTIPQYKLNNPYASGKTKKVFTYLQGQYGKKTLAGQQVGGEFAEVDYIEQHTGEKPAILGFDMLHQVAGWHDKQVDNAIKWHRETGGLVQLTWHWFTPKDELGEERGSFYSDKTDFNVRNAIIPGTEEYDAILRDIHAIARQLKRLEENDVPVLWRPLHEAGGYWFWWSGADSSTYKALWNLMYTILQEEYKLNNLIWVWSGYSELWEWYVGDDRCDIVARDVYYVKDLETVTFEYKPGAEMFIPTQVVVAGKKIISMTETDQFPDPDKMLKEKVYWGWFMPWYGEFIIGERFNTTAKLKEVYGHDFVITLDELPDFR